MTVTVLEVVLVAVDELEPHPESRPSPAPLTISKSSICRRLRFLKPRKQKATARVAAGMRGRGPVGIAFAVEAGETESVVTADWPAKTVRGSGLKLQVYPEGSPLQANETVPANEFTELRVNWVIPTVPGWTVRLGSEKSKVKDGDWPSGLTIKLCVTDGAAAKVALSPGCVAMMVQVPEVTNVAVVPETVQTGMVDEVKETAKPDVAVATSASGVPRT